MLELERKDFKLVIITMLNDLKRKYACDNEKIENLSIETVKRTK